MGDVRCDRPADGEVHLTRLIVFFRDLSIRTVW
jgi:hypothetical protein